MQYLNINYLLTGFVPTIMHNGRTADPLNEYTKAMREITSKRKKTDEDHLELQRREFMAGLYVNDDGAPCWPCEAVEAMLIAAAKKHRMGTQFKSAVFVDGSCPLIYDGPKDAEGLWEVERFRDTRAVVVNRGRVMRTRPIFRLPWAIEVPVSFDDSVVNESDIDQAMVTAGRLIGLSDFRPKYGRFEVERIK